MRKQAKLHNWLLKFDRTFSDGLWKQIIILGAVFLIAVIIGLIICYFLPFGKEGERIHFYEWAVYLLIDGNALNSLYNANLPAGDRPWVVIFAILGSLLGVIVFGGMLISVLSNMLQRRIENYRSGKNVYVTSGHYIILGYDEIVPSIIKQICTPNKKNVYILLQSSLPTEFIASKLHSSIAQDCERQVIIKNGHRTSKNDLKELRLNQSQSIFVVGDRSKDTHDAMNIDCLENIYDVLSENKQEGMPESITTVFEYQETYTALQVVDLFENIKKLGIEFIPHNFYTDWARQIFVSHNNSIYPNLDDTGITADSQQHVHIVIVGASTFGMTLTAEAAQAFHFPNFKGRKNLTEITIIDNNVTNKMHLFVTRFRHFFEVQSYLCGKFVKDKVGNVKYDEISIPASKFEGKDADFLDIQFRFVSGNIYERDVQDLLSDWANEKDQIISLFFTLPDNRQNMSAAMNLPDNIYDNGIPIFIRQNTSSLFINKIRQTSQEELTKATLNLDGTIHHEQLQRKFAKLYPFGMTDIVFDMDKQVLKIAQCINHVYEVYKHLNYSRVPNIQDICHCSLEDIHKEWIALPVALQWSNIYCAYNITYRIHTIQAIRNDYKTPIKDVSDDEVKQLAFVEHNRWNVEKLMLGYRKPSTDEDSYVAERITDKDKAKEMKDQNKNLFIHSDIRPYSSLNEIQDIDNAIIRLIPWFIEMSKQNN